MLTLSMHLITLQYSYVVLACLLETSAQQDCALSHQLIYSLQTDYMCINLSNLQWWQLNWKFNNPYLWETQQN